jgi:hypothetical protein
MILNINILNIKTISLNIILNKCVALRLIKLETIVRFPYFAYMFQMTLEFCQEIQEESE